MKEKPSVDELQSLFDASIKKMELFIKENLREIIREELKGIKSVEETPPDSLSSDISIKMFPPSADIKDREMLDKLAKVPLIDRELLPENKYKLARSVYCKDVIRELLKHGYNKNSGFTFMKQFIDYHVEDATIQNYLRECKRDLPIKSKNV